jgi:hypothetical protein
MPRTNLLIAPGKTKGAIAAASNSSTPTTAAVRTRSLGRAFLGRGTLVLKGIP